jgi:hypothetical protein
MSTRLKNGPENGEAPCHLSKHRLLLLGHRQCLSWVDAVEKCPAVVSFGLGEAFSAFLAGRRGLIGEHNNRPASLAFLRNRAHYRFGRWGHQAHS